MTSPEQSARDFSTRAIHVGQAPDPTTGAIVPPLYLTTTFLQDGVGNFRNGYEYARGGNPTRDVLQELLADLEGGRRALDLPRDDGQGHGVVRPGDKVEP